MPFVLDDAAAVATIAGAVLSAVQALNNETARQHEQQWRGEVIGRLSEIEIKVDVIIRGLAELSLEIEHQTNAKTLNGYIGEINGCINQCVDILKADPKVTKKSNRIELDSIAHGPSGLVSILNRLSVEPDTANRPFYYGFMYAVKGVLMLDILQTAVNFERGRVTSTAKRVIDGILLPAVNADQEDSFADLWGDLKNFRDTAERNLDAWGNGRTWTVSQSFLSNFGPQFGVVTFHGNPSKGYDYVVEPVNWTQKYPPFPSHPNLGTIVEAEANLIRTELNNLAERFRFCEKQLPILEQTIKTVNGTISELTRIK